MSLTPKTADEMFTYLDTNSDLTDDVAILGKIQDFVVILTRDVSPATKSTKLRYLKILNKNKNISDKDKTNIKETQGFTEKDLDLLSGAKSVVRNQRELKSHKPGELSLAEVREMRAQIKQYKAQAVREADVFDIEAQQTEEESVQILKRLEEEAQMKALEDAAKLDPNLQLLVDDIKSLKAQGKLTIDESMDLLKEFREFIKQKRTMSDSRGFIEKYGTGPLIGYFNTWYSKYGKDWCDRFAENEENIYLVMRFVWAGVNLWAIWSLPNFVLSAVTLYFGGVMPWTEGTYNWSLWIMSFIGSDAYWALFGASILAWIWMHAQNVTTSMKGGMVALWTWAKSFFEKGGLASKDDMMTAFNALPPDAKASILANFNSKVENLKSKSPGAEAITQIQMDEAATIENRDRQSPLVQVLAQQGTPADAAKVAPLNFNPNTFGSDDPNALPSSSSAASGGLPGGLPGDNNVGGRRRRRTKRRSTRRSTKRSTRRGRKTKRSKRSKRSRRHR